MTTISLVRNPRGVGTVSVILVLLASWVIFLEVLGSWAFGTVCAPEDKLCTTRPGIYMGVFFVITGLIGVRLSCSGISNGGRHFCAVLFLICTIVAAIAAGVYFVMLLVNAYVPHDPIDLRDAAQEVYSLFKTYTGGLDIVRKTELVVLVLICLFSLIGSCYGCCNACCNRQEVKMEIVTVSRPPITDTIIVNPGGGPVSVYHDSRPAVGPAQYTIGAPNDVPLNSFGGLPPGYSVEAGSSSSGPPHGSAQPTYNWTKFSDS